MAPSTHLFQWHGHGWASWPAPLSRQIDRWLWASVLFSTVILSIFVFCHHNINSKSKESPGQLRLALTIVTLFYNSILLVLSYKERRITLAAEAECDVEEAEDIEHSARMRSTIIFLMLAMCQSFLVTLGLYVAIRLIFALRAPVQSASGPPLLAYSDLGFAAGQMVLMVYMTASCIFHEVKIGTYLRLHQGVDVVMKETLRVDHLDEE
ncbi:hypothetical protein BDZ97DRAFT_1915874 [Flammula alnicola]|nr:hypothetical protein BDZ97DRAFT_1915874 [Flammula alnicola]